MASAVPAAAVWASWTAAARWLPVNATAVAPASRCASAPADPVWTPTTTTAAEAIRAAARSVVRRCEDCLRVTRAPWLEQGGW